MPSRGSSRPSTGHSTGLALLGIFTLALVLRLLGAEQVFQSPDVIFRGFDSYYHVRRALYSLVHFPGVLERDPLLNYPHGSAVPWPPLYDLSLAAVAKLAGGDEAALERVAACVPPLLGALAVLPAFALGRRLGGRGAGLLAAGLLAVIEGHVAFSRAGFADHHAAASLLGMGLLATSAAAVDRTHPARPRTWIGLTLLRAALVLAVPGSVVPLAAIETGLMTAGALEPDAARRARLRRAGLVSALATAALLLPLALAAATTADYGMNPNYFTTFHPALYASIAGLHVWLGALERWRGAAGATTRLARLAGGAAALAVVLVASSEELRRGLDYGLRFLSGTHSAADRVVEERPLLAYSGELDPRFAMRLFGLAGFALPLALLHLGLAARDAARRPALGLLALWLLLFGVLGLAAVRFANELSGAAAVALALLAAAAWRALAPRLPRSRRLRAAFACAALLLLLAPTLAVPARRLGGLWHTLAGEPPAPSVEASMYRFARLVRTATPETGGFLDAEAQPEYGIFAWSGLGHHLHYVARRATAADNFGPVTGLDDRNFLLSDRVFRYRRPARALRVLRRLGTPYVITTDFNWDDPDVFLNRLHRDDASARGDRAAIARLRLLVESRAQGRRGSRFKLFERVRGALLELDAPPGAPVEARVALRTNRGRNLVWSNRSVAGASGRARLRVPYATEGSLAQTRAVGPVEVFAGDGVLAVEVHESDVREGVTIDLAAGRPAARRRSVAPGPEPAAVPGPPTGPEP